MFEGFRTFLGGVGVCFPTLSFSGFTFYGWNASEIAPPELQMQVERAPEVKGF